MPNALIIATVAGYALTATLLIARCEELKTARKCYLPLALWGGTLILHAVLLSLILHTPKGLDLSLANAISMVSWMASAILMGAALRYPVTSLGSIVLPITALAVAGKLLIPDENNTIIQASQGLQIHIITSLLAYSVLSLGAIQSLILAYQDAHIRKHKLKGWVRKLPPLQHMENLLFQIIWVGFLLLSLSLFSGFMFLEDLFAQHLIHKTVLSIAAWIIFAILLGGRQLAGWRGRMAIRWTLIGFILLMIAYFGSKLVLEFFIQPS